MKVPAAIDHLIIPIRIVIVVALLYAIGQTVWFFVFGAGNENDKDLSDLREFNMPTEVSVNDIIDANLFGELPKEEIEPIIQETTLNLKLVGISYNEADPSRSRAYIVGRTKAKAVRCAVGERVDGVEVSDIFADHVLLMRGGKKESLYVEQREPLITTVEETSAVPEFPSLPEGLITQGDINKIDELEDATATTESGWVRQIYNTYRDQIENDPDQVLNELGFTPMAEESAAGYRLNATMAERLGLRTGDILLSVNDYSVGNVQEDLSHFEEHLDADSLKLVVQRGEAKITINYKPNQ